MVTLQRHNHVLDWPGLDWPDRVARILDFDRDRQLLHVEEYHDDDTVVIRVDIPGVDPDKDIEISTADGFLTIKAHREEKSERRSKSGYRSEVRYGSFERHIALPDTAKAEDVKAAYRDGVLEVRVPCQEELPAEPKRVPITRA